MSCLSSFISAFNLRSFLLPLGFSPVAYPIASFIAYAMSVISGMISALGKYRRRILFVLSWISSDIVNFGSFSLGSIWSKMECFRFSNLIEKIVQVLYCFLQVPHPYLLERSQLLQHPLPIVLLHHYWQLAQQYCLLPQGYSLSQLPLPGPLPSSHKEQVLYFWVLFETSGIIS